MIRRLYIDNYRCFRNFELRLDALPCAMIIGSNGVGKSTIGEILQAFHCIGDGIANADSLFPPHVRRIGSNSERVGESSQQDVVSLELEVGDGRNVWVYSLAFHPVGWTYEVVQERLMCGEDVLLDRASLSVVKSVVACAVTSDPQIPDRIERFRAILRDIVVVRPIPRVMSADALLSGKSLAMDCSNFCSWLFGLLSSSSAVYEAFRNYLACVMPDFVGVQKSSTVRSGHQLVVRFKTERENEYIETTFDMLSDGEKCQFVAAAILARNIQAESLVCFWDEPDNYITTSEIDNLLPALCKSFVERGQLVVSSHSREAISAFGENEVIALRRAGHIHAVLPPVSVRDLRGSGQLKGSLDAALLSGKVVRE